MGLSLRNRPFNHLRHPLRRIRSLRTQIRPIPYPTPVNIPRPFLLPPRHRRPLQFHVLRHLHLVHGRVGARSPPLVCPLCFLRPHTRGHLRFLYCFYRRLAHSTSGCPVDPGDRRTRSACRSDHPCDDAGAAVVLAVSVSGHSNPVVLSGFHLHGCRYHRE